MRLRRPPYDPYRSVEFPPFRTFQLPDVLSIRPAQRGDTAWVLDITPALAQAERAAHVPTQDAVLLTNTVLKPYGDKPSDAERLAIAQRVQWALSFALADIHRLNERPPVAHVLMLNEIIARTQEADTPAERFLAEACRIAFVYGRAGPGFLDLNGTEP